MFAMKCMHVKNDICFTTYWILINVASVRMRLTKLYIHASEYSSMWITINPTSLINKTNEKKYSAQRKSNNRYVRREQTI